MALLKLGKHKDSRDVASRALEINPNHVKARYRRAVAHRKLGDLVLAQVDLEVGLTQDSKNAEIRKELALVQKEQMKQSGGSKLSSQKLKSRNLIVPIAIPDQYCRKCNIKAKDLPPNQQLMMCPECKRYCYCSQKCFKADWKQHKLVCKGLNEERRMAKGVQKMHKEWLGWKNDPEKRDFIETMNRMEGKAPDFDRIKDLAQDESKMMLLNGLLSTVNLPPDQPDDVWGKISDKSLTKKAKKVVAYLANNHDRRGVQFNTYADLYEKQGDVWNSIFEDTATRKRFLEVLADSIELDATTLRDLPDKCTEDDMGIKSTAGYIIPKIPFGPHKHSNGGRKFFIDQLDCYYGSRCWPMQLLSTLALWKSLKRPGFVTNFGISIQTCNMDGWRYQVLSLSQLGGAEAPFNGMFRYCVETDGKAFHDPSCQTLNYLLELLSIEDGPRAKREEFKSLLYLVAAFILLFSQHPDNSNLVSTERLVETFEAWLPAHCLLFLNKVAYPFATKMLSGEYKLADNSDLQIFERYLAKHPKLKRMM